MKLVALAGALVIGACSPQASNETSNSSGDTKTASDAGSEEAPSRNGPFGFAMGDDPSAYKLKKMEKPGFYETDAPPKSHDDFESVLVEAYPGVGICMIKGLGKNLENDGNGSSVRTKVSDLTGALETKYGKSTKVDLCTGGDIQCGSDFWMMTLNGGERYYGSKWSKSNDAMKQAKIGQIYVGASAGNISTSYVIAEYISADTKGCEKAARAISASSL